MYCDMKTVLPLITVTYLNNKTLFWFTASSRGTIHIWDGVRWSTQRATERINFPGDSGSKEENGNCWFIIG